MPDYTNRPGHADYDPNLDRNWQPKPEPVASDAQLPDIATHRLTITLTIAEILALPGDAVLALLSRANPSAIVIRAAYLAESTGKARWPVINALRTWKPAKVGCAACDRGDHQLGHAEECPKNHNSSPI